MTLDCAFANAELVCRLGNRLVEPVAKHHDFALHLRQLHQSVDEHRPFLIEGWDSSSVRYSTRAAFASPRTARLVDSRSHQGGTDKRFLSSAPPNLRPGDVRLLQRRLQQVLGIDPVTAEGIRDPAKRHVPSRDELLE